MLLVEWPELGQAIEWSGVAAIVRWPAGGWHLIAAVVTRPAGGLTTAATRTRRSHDRRYEAAPARAIFARSGIGSGAVREGIGA